VGYSQHCLGQRRDWSETPRFEGTHPIVYVALGSHANYFTPGLHQFNLACVPAQVLAILGGFHLPPPADVVSADGAVTGPPEAALPPPQPAARTAVRMMIRRIT